MLFWDFYAYLRYINYVSTYFDIGLADYNLYYYSVEHVSLLQYLVFMNHVSFITPLLYLFYKIFGNPFSFIWLQNLMLAFTAPFVYLIGKMKSNRIGIAFAISYLINPALWGLGVFDAHLEGLLPFFYMLSLYLYLRGSKFFLLSFALLLSVIDTGAALALFFAIGLIFYEYLSKRKRKKMVKELIASIALSILFIALYWHISISINSNVPPQLKAMNFFGEQKNVLINSTSNKLGLASIFWLLMAFFSFGISILYAFLPSLLFLLPWIGEVFAAKNILFINPYMQYFAYAIGGLAGSLLGAQSNKLDSGKIEKSTYAFSIIFLLSFLAIYHFPSPFAKNQVSTNLDIILNASYANTSIMAQGSITPHLYNMLYVENPPDEKPLWFEKLNYTTYWFKPEYIILDKNLSDFGPMNSSSFNIYAYMGSNYSLYYQKNGVEIYKLR